MTASPLVSIIIPAYNVAPFIGETLDSIFAQTVTDFEIIVVNDGSTDELEHVLKPYRGRIVYLRQENQGQGTARNAGLGAARGKYVALLDGDDMWYPHYLERMISVLNGYDVAYPNARIFGFRDQRKLFLDLFPSSQPVTYEKLLARECVVFVSALFRREPVAATGILFDRSKRGNEDLEFWLRLARSGLRFTFTREVLARYRRRPDSCSQSRSEERDIYVYERLLAEPGITPAERRIIDAQIALARARISLINAKKMIRDGKYEPALAALTLVRAARPSLKVAMAMAGLRLAPRAMALFMNLRGADGW